MNKIAKNYIYNMVYQLLTLVIPLLMTPYISRVLGASQLGIYDYNNSVVTLVVTISLFGIGHYGSREIAYVRDDGPLLSRTFWSILLTQFFLGLVCFGVFWGVAISSNYYIYTISFGFWVLGTIIDCTWIYVGVEDMEHAVVKNIIAKLLFILGTLLFVKTPDDLILYIFLNGLSVLLANILAYSSLRKYISKPTFHISLIWRHIIGSLKLFLPVVAIQLLLSINKIILGTLVTDIADVAYYGNAEKIVQIPLSLIMVMNTVMMPRLANEFRNKNRDNIERYMALSSGFSIFLSVPLMVGIFIISDSFIPWFLGSEFISSISIVKMLTPIILFNTLLGISGNQYLVATNKMKPLLISNILSAVTNIVLDLILVPYFGIYGICIATIVGLLVALCIQYNTIRKEISILFIFRYLIKYLSMALVMGLVIKVLFFNAESVIATTAFQGLIGLVVYVLIGIVLGDEILFKLYNQFTKSFGRKS
ncbi:TPA: flippase [Streptococcus suis]|nr:flippase [Streptococcus suis]